jgi:UDP-glucose 4-epimerase
MTQLKEKNILILGGLGFVGSNLAHKCVNLGSNVTIFDPIEPSLNSNLTNIEEIQDKVKLIKGDIRNFPQIKEAVLNQDIVFNCAGQTSHPKSMRNPHLDIDINCKGTINVLESLRRYNDKAKVVYVGSTTQVGKNIYAPADENHPEFPRDIYSANKSVAEKYNLIYNYIYGIKTVVLRASNSFGPRAPLHSSDIGFMNYFIGLALQNKELTLYGEGTQKRTVTFIKDLVNAIILATYPKDIHGETFFAVGDLTYTVKQIAEIIVKIFGSGKVTHIPWPEERQKMEVGDSEISNKRIKNSLEWEPKYDISMGLMETKAYYNKDKLKKYI